MHRTRSSPRQPKAGPSRRSEPRAKANVPGQIIELSDSDDDPLIASPPRKRQRMVNVDADAVDLTCFDLGSPRASTEQKSSFSTKGMGKNSETGREKIQEKTFTDLTNEQNPQDLRISPFPSIVSGVVQEAPVKLLDRYLSQVLEVVPDVQPEHARSLLAQYQELYGDDVVATTLHLLFEQPYPKVERSKGKRKRDGDDSVGQPVQVSEKDYNSKDRIFEGGSHYAEISLNQLTIDFPRIPLPHIRQTLHVNNSFYTPTHLMLREQLKEKPPPFKLKTTATRTRSTGKGKLHDAEFERELAWLLKTLQGEEDIGDEPSQQEVDDGECEDGIECGCCFSTYVFDKMVQCPDAHLFCIGCMTSYVENQLGQHDPNIRCMEQSGCKLTFSDAELKRILSSKLLDLYERVKQTKEIEAAELDGLEECPFCEYKVVIENPDEKLFRCERDECNAVSCRACKKLDHLPKNCKEAAEDKGLDARHIVEEAMTEALMRNCPKCRKGFIKESGCNKMCCPYCRTLSCYICRQIIKGYDHFNSTPPGRNRGQGSGSKQKCALWDPVEQRHDQEVAEAREKAIKEMENVDPEVDKKQLEVELPKTAPAADARAVQARVNAHHILAGFPNGLMPALPAGVANFPVAVGNDPARLVHRMGINIGLQFEPIMHAMPQYFQQRFQQQPPAADLAADIAARRNEAHQQNLEAMRRVGERQELVRQQFELYRRQLDNEAQALRIAHAPFHFDAIRRVIAPEPAPARPYDFPVPMQLAAPVGPAPVRFDAARHVIAPEPAPVPPYGFAVPVQPAPVAPAVPPQAALVARARPVRRAARRR